MLSHWQMQALIGLLVFVLLVQAQLAIDDFPTSGVEAGKSYTITYSPKDQTPTEIILRQGPSNSLSTVATLGTATGGSFTWTVAANLQVRQDYTIEIRRGSTNNFSPQFGLTGGSSIAGPISNPPPQQSSISSIVIVTPTPSSVGFSSSLISSSTSKSATSGPSGGSNAASRDDGLPPGSIAGIAVGLFFAVLLLAIGAFFLRRSLRNRSKKKASRSPDVEIWEGKPELDGSSTAKFEMSESTVVSDPVTLLSDDASVPGAHLKELSATKKFELDARSTRSLRELQATSIRNSDLPSTSQGNTEISFPSRDTYDDPRITQNPWVRNDPDQRS